MPLVMMWDILSFNAQFFYFYILYRYRYRFQLVFQNEFKYSLPNKIFFVWDPVILDSNCWITVWVMRTKRPLMYSAINSNISTAKTLYLQLIILLRTQQISQLLRWQFVISATHFNSRPPWHHYTNVPKWFQFPLFCK